MSSPSQKSDQLVSSASLDDSDSQDMLFHIFTPWSYAVVRLRGGTILRFHKRSEYPLLFLSKKHNVQNKIHHGGVPLCFPWFGSRSGEKEVHGFARDAYWKLKKKKVLDDNRVVIEMILPPEEQERQGWTPVLVTNRIVVGEKLELFFKVHNNSDKPYTYEACFHPYFYVKEVDQAFVKGLQGVRYLDKLDDFKEKEDQNETVSFAQKNDRIYLDTASIREISVHDLVLKRKTVLKRKGSNATVVWNPSPEEAKNLRDTSPGEYHNFVCVEAGAMHPSRVLQQGEKSELRLVIGSQPL